MGRLDPGRAVADELQHLGGEQPDRPDRQPVGAVIVLLVLPNGLEIGAEDERRAVDEENVVAGADRTVGLGHAGRIGDVPPRAPSTSPAEPVNLATRLEAAVHRPVIAFGACNLVQADGVKSKETGGQCA